MGGHGGLNILPQKRWNVYNHDAREKVERDVKKHEEKQRQERIRQEQDEADVRYEVLKARKEQRAREERGDDEEKPKSYLNDELKSLMPEHFHLFKREEDTHIKDMRKQKNEEYEREKKMKEDRFVEQTTCYLGQTVKKSTPWYCQTAPTEEAIENKKNENRWGKPRGRDRERDNRRQNGNNQPSSVFKVPEDNYFQVLDLDSMKDKKPVSTKHQEVKEEKDLGHREENSVEKDRKEREKSRDKERKKDKKDKKEKKEKKDKKDKKHKKHKKNKSERKMSAESSVSRSRSRSKSQEDNGDKEREEERLKQEKLAKLRAERMKREQAEKRKAEKLIKETFPLGKSRDTDSYYYFN